MFHSSFSKGGVLPLIERAQRAIALGRAEDLILFLRCTPSCHFGLACPSVTLRGGGVRNLFWIDFRFRPPDTSGQDDGGKKYYGACV